MKRLLALPVLALAATLAGAGCPSSPTAGFDLGICARVSACFGNADGSFGAICETYFADLQLWALGGLGTTEEADLGAVQCIANAADCAAMRACTQATPAQAAACGATTVQACAGDVLVRCMGPGGPTAVDCAAAGTHCVAGGDTAACGTAACDPASTPPSCNGDLLIECQDGVLQSSTCAFAVDTSCSSSGTGPETCTTTVGNTCGFVGGTAQCVGSGAVCDPSTLPSGCDGNVVESCTGGKVGRFDCGQLGSELTCTTNPDDAFAFSCAGKGTECSASTPESCEGSVITYCWFGKTTTLDCTAYGLSGCTTTTQGGSTWAHCTE